MIRYGRRRNDFPDGGVGRRWIRSKTFPNWVVSSDEGHNVAQIRLDRISLLLVLVSDSSPGRTNSRQHSARLEPLKRVRQNIGVDCRVLVKVVPVVRVGNGVGRIQDPEIRHCIAVQQLLK
jgi:hypothetical protein